MTSRLRGGAGPVAPVDGTFSGTHDGVYEGIGGGAQVEGATPLSRAGEELSVGEVAKRSGVAVSALRFYESVGLIKTGISHP